MKYLIIYTDKKVIACEPYISGTAIAPGGGAQFMLTDLFNGKAMLDIAGVSYENIPELKNS